MSLQGEDKLLVAGDRRWGGKLFDDDKENEA
jgi:hypothetical protein